MKTTVATVVALVLVLLPATLAGAEEKPTFAETTTVVAVEIPVNVTSGQQAVRGLTAANFAVFEDQRPIELSGFEAIDLTLYEPAAPGEEPGEEAKVPVAGRRHFLLLFDLSFTRPDVLKVSLEAARDLVGSGFHPTDLVAVAVFSVSYGVDVLLGFTPDHRQAGKVIDVLELLLDRDGEAIRNAPRSGKGDPLHLVAGDVPSLVAQIGRSAGLQTTVPGEVLEWGYFGGLGGLQAGILAGGHRSETQAMRERERSAIKRLTDSLGEFARFTGTIDGRKFLVYFSEGFNSRLLGLDEAAPRSVRRWASLPDNPGGARTLSDLNAMLDQMRRSGWTIQSVNPAGLRHEEDDEWRRRGEDSLTMIAKDTGGELYRNFNDLSAAMEGMLAKTSVTYLLSFHARDLELDGSFHPLRITLRDAPPGADLLHPPGYYAPRPQADLTALERALEAADLILRGEEGGELAAGTLAAAFRGPEDAAQVAVWVEAEGPSLLGAGGDEGFDVELLGYVLGADRQIDEFFSQKVSLDPGKARKKLERGSLKFLSNLDLGPGSYELRLLVRVGTSGRYALRVVPLRVPDLTASELVVLPPMILDDPRRSMVVRESEGLSQEEAAARYPFKIGKNTFVPAVRPVLAADQKARICVMAYHLDPARMLFSAGVVASDGTQVERERLTMVGKSETTAEGLDQLILDFDPKDLAPGEYTLRVGITDRETGVTAAQAASFRVAGPS